MSRVDEDQPLSLVERRAFLRKPIVERRRILAEQAAAVVSQYEEGRQWKGADGGDVVEY